MDFFFLSKGEQWPFLKTNSTNVHLHKTSARDGKVWEDNNRTFPVLLHGKMEVFREISLDGRDTVWLPPGRGWLAEWDSDSCGETGLFNYCFILLLVYWINLVDPSNQTGDYFCKVNQTKPKEKEKQIRQNPSYPSQSRLHHWSSTYEISPVSWTSPSARCSRAWWKMTAGSWCSLENESPSCREPKKAPREGINMRRI